jgi:hypothetical protein
MLDSAGTILLVSSPDLAAALPARAWPQTVQSLGASLCGGDRTRMAPDSLRAPPKDGGGGSLFAAPVCRDERFLQLQERRESGR